VRPLLTLHFSIIQFLDIALPLRSNSVGMVTPPKFAGGEVATMARLLLPSVILVLLVGVPARAQQTKELPDDKCSFTLPDDDWVWLDPSLVKCTKLAVLDTIVCAKEMELRVDAEHKQILFDLKHAQIMGPNGVAAFCENRIWPVDLPAEWFEK
jgi:hypothetical protein